MGEPQLADNACLTRDLSTRLALRLLVSCDTRSLPRRSEHRLEYMKPIVQTANVEEETVSLKELIPFWFAVSSPLLGMLLGLLGAWVVAWLTV